MRGKSVYGLDLAPSPSDLLEYENYVFVQDSIKNYDVVRALISQAECICHLAGIATPMQYLTSTRKVIDITAVASLQLIEMARLQEKMIFFTSTSEIYGKSAKLPFREDGDRVLGSTTTARWCYSSSKAVIEHYLDACAVAKELDYITVRLFNVYGPGLQGRVVSRFLEQAKSGESLTIHGSGDQTRCFTYIDDAIEAFLGLLDTDSCRNNVFNVGHTRETSIKQLAEIVKETCNPKCTITMFDHQDFYGKGYEDIDRRVPDTEKIKEHIGWTPTTSLEEGLSRMFAEL